MKWISTRLALNLVFWFLTAGSGLECSRTLLTDYRSMIGGISIGPALYFGLTVSGAVALVWINLAFFRRMSPRNKRRVLAGDSEGLLNLLELDVRVYQGKVSRSTEIHFREFDHKLGQKRVPRPVLSDISGWLNFLPALTAKLRTGTMRETRQLWPAIDKLRKEEYVESRSKRRR